jgi:O-methyltransferase/aklanonic acid methyltransferase
VDAEAQLAEAWDAAAPGYDRTAFSHHAEFGRRLAQLVLLGPGGRVLDVGCGAGGALIPAAHRVGPTGEAVGIDIAPGMVARTREAAEAAGLGQVRAEVMDGAALDFEDDRFDAVLCAFTLDLIADAEGALAEMRRVLRPTGTIGVSIWEALTDNRWVWENEARQQLNAEVPPELLEAVGQLVGRFSEAGPLRELLEDAGFQDVTIERMVVERTYPDAEAWWEWLWSLGSRAFLEAAPEAAVERLREEGVRRLEAAGEHQRTRQFVALLARARM